MQKRLFLLLALVLPLTGCGDDDSSTDPFADSEVGTYILEAVGGNALPVYFGASPTARQHLAVEITLKQNGAFTHSFEDLLVTSNTTINRLFEGTYTRESESIVLTYKPGGVYLSGFGGATIDTLAAKLRGDVLTHTILPGGAEWVYRRSAR